MQFKPPKNDAKYKWTSHVYRKMMHYGLSADRIKRVIRAPKRAEDGVAPGTIAVMQSAGTKAKPWEIWVMYAQRGSHKIVITSWKYPGTSRVRDQIPIPADVLIELENEGFM